MLREQAKLINRLSFVINTALIVVAFALAYAVRDHYQPPLLAFRDYAWVLLIIIPVWLYLLTKYRLFSSLRYVAPFELCRRLFAVHLWGGMVLATTILFFDRYTFSRGVFGLFLVFSLLSLFALHLARRLLLGFLRRKGVNYRQLIIVGNGGCSRRFLELVDQHADWGLKIKGFVQVELPLQQQLNGYPVLGQIDNLLEVCKAHPVDEVVFCLPKERFFEAEQYITALEEMGTTARMVLNLYDMGRSRRELTLFHEELPIITFHTKSLDSQQLFLKRVMDIIGSVIGLVITAFLLPFIALAIKLESKGPVLFSQERIGLNGRIFHCWKLRSMVADAETQKAELLERNEMKGAMFKIADDPRVTKVGRFLRKSSIDELPQFWNVLKGEMSLVGTRPPTPQEVASYENWHRRRISIKPGMTGLWQVSGRNQISVFDEIVKLDIRYIERWNLWLDIKIILKTLWILLIRRGAC